MLISISLAVAPTVNSAVPFHSVKGTLYLNDDAIAPEGIEIRLVFDEGTNYTLTYEYDLYGDNTNYNLGFTSVNGHADDETGTFVVEYNGLEYTPIDNQTIFIDGDVWNYYMDLRIDTSAAGNSPPYEPSDPDPYDNELDVGANHDLSWTGGDPDIGDTVTYDVYIDKSDPPTTLASDDQSATSYDPGTLDYEETYYWQIIAEDNNGASTDGPIWSFTTGTNDPPNKPTLNSPADGSTVGSETSATLKVDVTDPDGDTMDVKFYKSNGDELGEDTGVTDGGTALFTWSGLTQDTSYQWYAVADDGEFTNQSATWSFKTKAKSGSSNPIIIDDEEEEEEEEEELVLNNPPANLTVTGNATGSKNTNYTFTANATDPDENDTICYTFNWSDGTNDTITGYFASGIPTDAIHQWAAAGIYTIKVYAMDSYNSTSDTVSFTILIDAIYVKDIGYLLDNDGDGTYEDFYNNETGNTTSTEYDEENESYLLNSDGAEGWEWVYEPPTDTLTEYSEEEPASGDDEPEPEQEDNSIWYMLGLGIIIAILLLLGIYYYIKKKEESKKKTQQKKKSTKKK